MVGHDDPWMSLPTYTTRMLLFNISRMHTDISWGTHQMAHTLSWAVLTAKPGRQNPVLSPQESCTYIFTPKTLYVRCGVN